MNTELRFHHKPDYTLLYVALVGLGVIMLVCFAGCGSVSEIGVDADGGAAGAAGATGVAGELRPDAGGDGGSAGKETARPDAAVGGAGGAGDTGGSSGAAAMAMAGSSGAAGDPGRALGAGCTADAQCGSGICDGATQACCDGYAGTCSACVAGHITATDEGKMIGLCAKCSNGQVVPLPDGTICGSVTDCAGDYHQAPGPNDIYASEQTSACSAGDCVPSVVTCSSVVTSCPTGQHPACVKEILTTGGVRIDTCGCTAQ